MGRRGGRGPGRPPIKRTSMLNGESEEVSPRVATPVLLNSFINQVIDIVNTVNSSPSPTLVGSSGGVTTGDIVENVPLVGHDGVSMEERDGVLPAVEAEVVNGDVEVEVTGSILKAKRQTLPAVNDRMTWKEKVLGRASVGIELEFIQGGDGDEVIIDENDIEKELNYWQNTLVGQVLGARVTEIQLKDFAGKYWNHISTPSILYYKKGWFYFRFASAADMHSVLRGGQWSIGRNKLILKQWSPTIGQELETASLIPVWVTFPDLEPHLWSQKALSKIASKIGKPLFVDAITAHKEKLAFARVMIEVDVAKPLTEDVLVSSPHNGTQLQRVDYEWVPYYCEHCKKLGHVKDHCRLLKKTVKPTMKQVYVIKKAPMESKVSVIAVDESTGGIKEVALAEFVKPTEVAKLVRTGEAIPTEVIGTSDSAGISKREPLIFSEWIPVAGHGGTDGKRTSSGSAFVPTNNRYELLDEEVMNSMVTRCSIRETSMGDGPPPL